MNTGQALTPQASGFDLELRMLLAQCLQFDLKFICFLALSFSFLGTIGLSLFNHSLQLEVPFARCAEVITRGL